jgi:hypothetical protein
LNQSPANNSAKLVLDLALHEEQGLADRANWLDTKTGVVLGFGIVSVAELLGFLILASADHRHFGFPHRCLISLLFCAGLIALITGMFLGFAELGPIGFAYGPSTQYLANQFQRDEQDIRVECIQAMKETSAKNKIIIQRKARLLRLTVIFMAAALLCGAALAVILFFYVV